ncbi:DNA repair and recombination protein rad54b, partial [Rhizophlyctis rosea]
MFRKPFKPPKRKSPPPSSSTSLDNQIVPSPSGNTQDATESHHPPPPTKRIKLASKSLLVPKPKPVSAPTVAPSSPAATSVAPAGSSNACYSAVWRKKQQKKHKTWDGDGILIVKGKNVTLCDTEGKEIGKSSSMLDELSDGAELTIGGKEVEVTGRISWSDYTSGKCFVGSAPTPIASSFPPKSIKLSKFKQPTISGVTQVPSAAAKVATPRHNPLAENSLVMPRPKPEK